MALYCSENKDRVKLSATGEEGGAYLSLEFSTLNSTLGNEYMKYTSQYR